MKKFTVLVIGDDVEKQLEPYKAQDFDPKYGAFYDLTEEYLNKYNNESCEVIITPYSIIHCSDIPIIELLNGGPFISPKNSIKKFLPLKELYPTFEEFVAERCNFKKKDPETGKYGYWENPNGKWSRAVVRGESRGFFKQKKGWWVNHIAIGDIDFKFMKKLARIQAHRDFNIVEGILNGREIPRYIKSSSNDMMEIDKVMTEYYNHPVIRDFKKYESRFPGFNLFEEYGCDRKTYVAKCRDRAGVTYAVIKDGKLYQRGEIEWLKFNFSNEKPEKKWNREFWRLLDDLPPETMLTLVDCRS